MEKASPEEEKPCPRLWERGRSFLQLYLPVAAYALIFICGAFLLIKNALAREAEPDI